MEGKGSSIGPWKYPLPDPQPEGNSTISAGVLETPAIQSEEEHFPSDSRQSSYDSMDSGPKGYPWSFPAPQQAAPASPSEKDASQSLQTPKFVIQGGLLLPISA